MACLLQVSWQRNHGPPKLSIKKKTGLERISRSRYCRRLEYTVTYINGNFWTLKPSTSGPNEPRRAGCELECLHCSSPPIPRTTPR